MSVANANGYPPNGGTSFSNATGLIPELYAKEFNIKYWAETLMPRISTGKFYEGVLGMGDKVYVAGTPSITTAAYTKGASLDAQVPTSTPITLTVDRARYFNLTLDDVDEKQSHLDVAGKYVEVGLKQMSQDIESEFFEDIVGAAHASNRGATAGAKSGAFNLGTTGAPLAITAANVVDVITRVRAVLAEQNATQSGKICIVAPVWFRYLLMNSELRQAYVTGDNKSVLRSGLVGSIDGVDIYESNLLFSETMDGQSGTHIYAFNPDAVSFIAQLNKSEKLRSTDTFATLFRSLMVYDWAVRKPEGLVEICGYNGGMT